jgi:HD-GYP domain-containing protein (c-di-GMP phosphodiesterase class II)
MLKKISVNDLRIGMYIHEICGSWDEHPFLLSAFALKSERDVTRFRQSSVTEVWIDLDRGDDVASEAPPDQAPQTRAGVQAQVEATLAKVSPGPPPDAPASYAQEVARASEVCARAKPSVISMFQEARMGKAIDPGAAHQLVDDISASVMRNPGAFLSLVRLKTADDYTYMHSIAVSALMVALGRQLGLEGDTLREVGMAGLLHDLGKAYIPERILNKASKLTDEEFEVMKGHPRAGYEALVKVPDVSAIALDVCLHHHEKTNGSGYPDGKPDAEISQFAKMAAVCDVYDAITSNRPYKRGWDPAESVRKMAEWAPGHFDQRIFHAFVKSLGIYPIGSLVRLESGQLAVVVDQTSKSLLTPLVRVIFSVQTRQLLTPSLLNLAAAGQKDRIVASEDPSAWGLDKLQRFLIHADELVP